MPAAPSSEIDSAPPRRRFLRAFALAAGAAGTGVLLAGCGGSQSEKASSSAGSDSTQRAAAAGASSSEENQCVPPSQLSKEAKAGRKKYDYVADSPHPQKHCSNCQFWKGAEAGETCGGCRLFAGPVHPQGYCTAYLRG